MSITAKTPIELACWRALPCSEAPASYRASAACYGLAKDVGVLAVVVAELELSEIQRQIFLAHVMVSADSSLEERPERLDIICVNLTADVFVRLMIHRAVRESLIKFLITRAFISSYQRDAIQNGLADESAHCLHGRILDNRASDIAFARDGSNDCDFVERPASALFLISVAILVLAADVSFVYLDNAHELNKLGIAHRGPQSMAHVPSGMERGCLSEKHAPKLARRNALFALKDCVENLEPSDQRMLCVFENRSNEKRESIGVTAPALRIRALPPPRKSLERVDGFALAATRAVDHAIRPAALKQKLPTGIFVGKSSHQLLERHHE
jgi:hypothetical protein